MKIEKCDFTDVVEACKAIEAAVKQWPPVVRVSAVLHLAHELGKNGIKATFVPAETNEQGNEQADSNLLGSIPQTSEPN